MFLLVILIKSKSAIKLVKQYSIVHTSGNGNNRTPQPKNWWEIIKEAFNKLVKHIESNTTLYLVGIIFFSVEFILSNV